MVTLTSVYDSIDYESKSLLKRYKKDLVKINKLTNFYRNLTDDELKQEAKIYSENFVFENKKTRINLLAIAREVTYRLLGKFQYDVQVLGALAALDRNIIQMSTGSGKTITLILPVVLYGLTHKGVNVLTVNEYLSERDWKETKPVYDWFGLSNAYVSHDMSDVEQRYGFDCDITYSTNSTLGFAYLNSALASDIGQNIKLIGRPLHAAIIDEVDEILMDDARNPLIIANSEDIASELLYFTIGDKKYHTLDVLQQLKQLNFMGYDKDNPNTIVIDDETLDAITKILKPTDQIFNYPKAVHILYGLLTALFQYKSFVDYVVLPEPDPDSGSRIALIDKATGRLSKGRTLADNLHSFIEMKEGVFTGNSNSSTIQITYQTLFNLFQTIAGVTGTIGTSFKEFKDIYRTGIVVIPDRLPNQLKQFTHLYVTKSHLYYDLVEKTKLYMSSRHPVLIGGRSDNEADLISSVLSNAGIPHKLLISTDKDEDAVVASAGKPGSVVVTTDIMGRGTDIHVEDTDIERGLVVLQVGSRPNSRVERQFAGRAARQGQPGRYHRLISLPELSELGMPDAEFNEILKLSRKYQDYFDDYNGDITLNCRITEYDDLVSSIDYTLLTSESAFSSSRVDEFMTYGIADLIQTAILSELDVYRSSLAHYMETQEYDDIVEHVTKLSLTELERKQKRKVVEQRKFVNTKSPSELAELLFAYTQRIATQFIPKLREFSDNASQTVRMGQYVKYDVPPESFMVRLMKQFLHDNESDLMIHIS